MSRKRRNKELYVCIANIIPCLETFYPKQNVQRNLEQIFCSNNWLKIHGFPMRRKPFVRDMVNVPEYVAILTEMKRMGLPVDKELMETQKEESSLHAHAFR